MEAASITARAAGAPSKVLAPPAASAAHLPALDGLRGLAVLMVMVFHQTALVGNSSAEQVLRGITGQGGVGVDLFFVLSGFLITGILLDSKGQAHYFRNFFARRFLRIFPLYYLILFVALVVLARVHHPRTDRWGHVEGIWYWAFLSNFYIARRAAFRHGILDVSWSLAIEEQFYLVWPWVVAACTPTALRRVCYGVLCATLAARGALYLAGVNPVAIHVLTFTRVDALAAGALIALQAREAGGLSPLVAPARWAGLVAFGASALGVIAYSVRGVEFWITTVGYTVHLALFASLLVLAVAAPPSGLVRRVASQRWLGTLGRLSYALYLFHNPVQSALRTSPIGPERLGDRLHSPVAGQLAFYVLATLATLPLAMASWHLFEKRWLSLKRYFPSGVAAAPG